MSADVFAPSYAQARRQFLEAAQAAGLSVESRIHPLKGREGEELAMDVAREGPPDADRVFILSSGCHGIEGYCGSGVQVAALRDATWRQYAKERGVAVLYVHALNPHGFSYLRRTTHENVDLNRNFHDFSAPLPDNAKYRALHKLLVPAEWPPSADNQQAIANYIAENGLAALQSAVSGGQHESADGLFFGGTAPTWSNLAIREVLKAHGRRAARLAWIDLHTGLGPNGVGERIFAGPDDAASVARARAWWDGSGATPVTSVYDGSSTSAFLTGLMWIAAQQECPQAEFTSIALEFGTVPILEVTDALRGDQWLQLHPQAPRELADSIKQRMRDAFFTDTPEWKSRILEQAREAAFQAVDGLAS
jgi:hypothetical protein